MHASDVRENTKKVHRNNWSNLKKFIEHLFLPQSYISLDDDISPLVILYEIIYSCGFQMPQTLCEKFWWNFFKSSMKVIGPQDTWQFAMQLKKRQEVKKSRRQEKSGNIWKACFLEARDWRGLWNKRRVESENILTKNESLVPRLVRFFVIALLIKIDYIYICDSR